jgi:hypothetical protein
MKNILKWAGLLTIALIVVLSCAPKKSGTTPTEREATESPQETVAYEPMFHGEILDYFQIDGITLVSGAFDGVITAQVENGDELNSIITKLFWTPTGEFDDLFLLSGSYSKGGFIITLPESLDVILSSMAGYPSDRDSPYYVHVSNRDARSCAFDTIYGLDSTGTPAAYFKLQYTGYEEEIYCHVSFWYVDRDVTLYNDTNKDYLLNLNLKTGWNKVYVFSGPASVMSVTAPPVNVNDMKWLFERIRG